MIGDGNNFVRTMASLAERGVAPASSTTSSAGSPSPGIWPGHPHLLDVGAPYGTYNVTSGGPAMTWATSPERSSSPAVQDPAAVSGTTTAAYAAGKVLAPRPRHSTLDLKKITATGFQPADGPEALRHYLSVLDRPRASRSAGGSGRTPR